MKLDKRTVLFAVLLSVISLTLPAQRNNRIYIPDMKAQSGRALRIPVAVDNTDGIVAMQFEFTLPEGLTLTGMPVVSDRMETHDVVARPQGNGKYLLVAYSARNTPVRGNKGTVLYIPAAIAPGIEEGSSMNIAVSDPVLSAADGENILTGSSGGVLEILKSPDITLTELTAKPSGGEAVMLPEGKLDISFKVSNTGGLEAGGGWKEQYFIVGPDGHATLLASGFSDTHLAPGTSVSRSCTVALPRIAGVDGPFGVMVRLVPDSGFGEPESLQGDNTASTGNVAELAKALYLTLPAYPLEEKNGGTVRCRIERSGSTSDKMIFPLTVMPSDARIVLPEEVTVEAGQSGATFMLGIKADGKLNAESQFTVVASGNGYPETGGVVELNDDTDPRLQLSVLAEEVTEGENLTLHLEAERAPKENLAVKLKADTPGRFELPSGITLPAGDRILEIKVKVLDDNVPDTDRLVRFTASAAGYLPGVADVLLVDDDIPALSLELTPNSVSEASGPLAVTGRIRRTGSSAGPVTIVLSDDKPGSVFYSSKTIEMKPGVVEAVFNLGPIDNSVVDGDRVVNITAGVFITSCSCAISGTETAGTVTVPLEITDNDGPTLTLTSALSVMSEGSVAEGTVNRNAGFDKALEIKLSSDCPGVLDIPQSVTIAEGCESASFSIVSRSNAIQGDSSDCCVTAIAEGFSKGSLWLTVSDATLPDARIESFSLTAGEAVAGGSVEAEVTVGNSGNHPLPELTKTELMSSWQQEPVAVFFLQEALQPGESVTFKSAVSLPEKTGEATLYAVVNPGNAVKELSYGNNTSAMSHLSVKSPFGVPEIKLSESVLPQPAAITVAGRIPGATEGMAVELYFINSGFRQTAEAVCRAGGEFETVWTPYSGQTGRFSVGVCYPGEGLKTEMAAFDVLGLRGRSSVIQCEPTPGETFEGTFELENPASVGLTGVKAEVLSAPAGCSAEAYVAPSIGGGETVAVTYRINSPSPSKGASWEVVKIRVSTAEGVEITAPVNFYCRPLKGLLQSSVGRINTTMTKGTARDYSFSIQNTGKGETGTVSLALPSWMKSVTPSAMASLEPGETAEIVLLLKPDDSMQLNVPVTGSIGINCSNGSGMALPFSIEPVSEDTGTLLLDVCDENTYFAAGSPHLEGAEVMVSHPVTGKTVATAVTGPDGLCAFTLPEGWYSVAVSAPGHDSYRNDLAVDPARETRKTVNLSIQAITVGWSVEETSVEDEYEITTTVKYETSVPVPVVVLSVPARIEAKSLAPGESLVFHAVLSNEGLVTAQDTKLLLPEGFNSYSFEVLDHAGPFALAPKQSVRIPVKVTRKAVPAGAPGFHIQDMDNDPCAGQVGTLYFWDCGLDRKWHRYHAALQLGSCNSNDPSTWDNSGNGNYGGSGSGLGFGWTGWGAGGSVGPAGGGYYSPDSRQTPRSTTDDKGCEPCQNRFLYKLTRCVTKRIPQTKLVWEIVDWVEDTGNKLGDFSIDKLLDKGEDVALKKTKPVWGWVKKGKEWIDIWGDCIVPLFEKCDPGNLDAPSRDGTARSGDGYPSYITEYTDMWRNVGDVQNYETVFFREMFGDMQWMEADETEFHAFLVMLVEMERTSSVDLEKLHSSKPANTTDAMVDALVRRWVDTRNGVTGGNTIDFNAVIDAEKRMEAALEYLSETGYGDLGELLSAETEKVMERLNEASSSVCSSVTLEFSQTMVLTRQAFRGTLTVANGHETLPMENVVLDVEVTGPDGSIATSREFQINNETLSGFTGELADGSEWTLAAGSDGKATVLFIPTKYAAPEHDVVYGFGGTLAYTDPFSGLKVTRILTPIKMTVKPSPELNLTYFVQRDILGDDPLTEEVEPREEAEFALLIGNSGRGDATDVRLTTRSPRITDNSKGLDVEFEFVSSQLNGEERQMLLGDRYVTDFGNIGSGEKAYAQWWLASTLLGHFTDYDVTATHVTGCGNPDLSLLGEVSVHELIRGFDVENTAGVKIRAFMTNDVTDADDMPDHIHFSDGTVSEVSAAIGAKAEETAGNEYRLTVIPGMPGWNYGTTADPTNSRQTLISVRRAADGRQLDPRSFWQTQRTLRDGKDPIYENLLHFAADMDAGESEYILTFTDKPEIELEVAEIQGIPARGTVSDKPVGNVRVVFNKPVNPATFTEEDLRLSSQGEAVELPQGIVECQSPTEFTVDLQSTATGDGMYVLEVLTADVTDAEGFAGRNGKQAMWVQYPEGFFELTAVSVPVEGGSVSPASGSYKIGTAVVLTAVPNEGYVFGHWERDGIVVSEDADFTVDIEEDNSYIAYFRQLNHEVEIAAGKGGRIGGASTGLYPHGSELHLEALPASGWVFAGWTVNGEIIPADSPELTLFVDRQYKAEARFTDCSREVSIILHKGWNWISTAFDDARGSDPSKYFRSIASSLKEINESAGTHTAPEGVFGTEVWTVTPGTYRILMERPAEFRFKGASVSALGKPVSLSPGWNWIPYLPAEEMTLSDAFAGLDASENDVVKGHTDFAVYSGGEWIGPLASMKPNNGYLYRSAATLQFRYPVSDGKDAAPVVYGVPDRDEFSPDYASAMTVVCRTDAGGASEMVVGAFSGGDCRGMSKPCGDLHFLTIHGHPGEEISFKAYDAATGMEYTMHEKIEYADDHTGSAGTPFLLTVDTSGGMGKVSGGFFGISPNPVKDVMHIAGDLGILERVDVYTLQGQRAVSADVFGCGVDVSGLPDGIYIAVFVTRSGVTVQKFRKDS